jgi:DMSO/TMAO reductase YedYZ molybdopterin-dependent catalytic subunit
MDLQNGDANNVDSNSTDAASGDAKPVDTKLVDATSVSPKVSERRFRQMNRRELLKLAPVIALGAFAIPALREPLLKQGLRFSDWASGKLFRSGQLAPTFADSAVTPLEKFPLNGYDVDDPGVIFESWTLSVSGAVEKPGEYSLSQIQALPRTRQNTRHTTARFITVSCADDYYESLDMATALHPQTLLCYEMYDQPLTREHGAPLRLNIPTKIGYKQAKYLTELKVTRVLDRVGYWEDQGYSWFYGL